MSRAKCLTGQQQVSRQKVLMSAMGHSPQINCTPKAALYPECPKADAAIGKRVFVILTAPPVVAIDGAEHHGIGHELEKEELEDTLQLLAIGLYRIIRLDRPHPVGQALISRLGWLMPLKGAFGKLDQEWTVL
jgi:hypothetical protein